MYTVNYPVAFHTVDMAIIKGDKVLLVQKPAEVASGLWRFPGGFVDPSDSSAEFAALREGGEETKMQFSVQPLYIGSMRMNDPRYRDSPHKIITSFYRLKWAAGDADPEGKFGGKDDIARTKWFDIAELLSMEISQLDKIINPVHTDLFQMFLTFIKTQNLS